jgi:hypothetical protein
MTSFHIGDIEPSAQNARSIVRLTSIDLSRAGLPEDEVLSIADATNETHIEQQAARLAAYPERYLGAIASRELIGYIKVNEWNRADQLPFTTGLHRIGQRALLAVGDNTLEGGLLGIHGFVVDDPSSEDRLVGMSLLEEALELAFGREVRIAQYKGDPMNYVTKEKGFIPTGKHGTILGIQQELHIRPAKNRNKNY